MGSTITRNSRLEASRARARPATSIPPIRPASSSRLRLIPARDSTRLTVPIRSGPRDTGCQISPCPSRKWNTPSAWPAGGCGPWAAARVGSRVNSATMPPARSNTRPARMLGLASSDWRMVVSAPRSSKVMPARQFSARIRARVWASLAIWPRSRNRWEKNEAAMNTIRAPAHTTRTMACSLRRTGRWRNRFFIGLQRTSRARLSSEALT